MQPGESRTHLPRRLSLITASVVLMVATVAPAAAASPPGLSLDAGDPEHRTLEARGRTTLADALRLSAEHPRRAHPALPPLSVDSGARAVPTRLASTIGLGIGRRAGSDRVPTGEITDAPAPDVTRVSSFAGIAASDLGLDVEPPDPWIAVNGSYVIQAVNTLVRISSRSGTAIETLPTWALWGIPPDHFDSDPRIVWDSFHSRWVGILLSYNTGYSDNQLNLIVSASADPLGSWDRYTIEFGPYLPDYPGIASSTDRIVLASDDFIDPGGGLEYAGPTLLVIPWSGILDGGSVPVAGASFDYADTGFSHFRPAQVLSSSATVHTIFEYGNHVANVKVGGTATDPSFIDEADLTDDLGIAPFSTPIDPRNSDGSTISAAVDERPTDAVWRNGRLWWVSTVVWDSGGSVLYDAGRVTYVTTTSTTPTAGDDHLFAVDGYDTYMPGVGISADNTAFIVMTASSDPNDVDPTTVGWRWNSIDGFNTTSPFLDLGEAPYTGNRWGDYVGVAADPSGRAAVWVADEVSAADGTWRTTVMRLVVDAVAPSVTKPKMSLVSPSILSSTFPVKIAWTGSDVGSGITAYQLEQNVDAAGWETTISSTTRTSVSRALSAGHSYRFRVTATDAAGNDSTAATSAKFRPYLYQQSSGSVVYSGAWSSTSNGNYSGGSVRYAGTAGRSATFTATAARAIAFVTTRGTSRGSFRVYIDGMYEKTVSAHSASTKYRQILYQYSWSASGTHKMKIVVVGTSGHPRVDVDAFAALKIVP